MEPSSPSHRRIAVAVALVLTALAFACGFVDPTGTSAKPLAIQRFLAVPPEVAAGTPTVLSWDVEGADSVELDNGIGMVQATGSRTIHPAATATYRLVAVSGTSLATASIRVLVTPAPIASPSPSPPPAPPKPSPSPSPSPG